MKKLGILSSLAFAAVSALSCAGPDDLSLLDPESTGPKRSKMSRQRNAGNAVQRGAV